MITASFAAWQINETVIGLMSEKYKGISFQKYLISLGLLEKEKAKNTKVEAQNNIAIAEFIKQHDKKRGG